MSVSVEEGEAERDRQRELRARQREERRRNKAQKAARIALAQCSQVDRPTYICQNTKFELRIW
jgi:hypothetical protein